MASLPLLQLFPSSSSPPNLLPLFPTSPDLHPRPPKRRRLLLPASDNTTNSYKPPIHHPASDSAYASALRTKLLHRFSNSPGHGDDEVNTTLAIGLHSSRRNYEEHSDTTETALLPPPPVADRKLRVAFEKLLTESDVSRGQDRLLLGKKSQGCLGVGNTPSAPDFRDVALVFHDMEELGRTWVLVHGFWPSSKAYVLKGKQWSKYRSHKGLKHNDILTISVDDADGGSLWISHCPSKHVPQLQQNVAPSQNLQPVHPDSQSSPAPKPPVSRRRLPCPKPIAWSPPPNLSHPAAFAVPRTPLGILDLNLELGSPSSNDWYPTYSKKIGDICINDVDDGPAWKRQQRIRIPATEASPSSSSISKTSECNSTCIINGSSSSSSTRASEELWGVSPSNSQEEVEQETALMLLELGRGLAKKAIQSYGQKR